MMLGKRIAALEAKAPKNWSPWHRIVQMPEQTLDQAIDAYGRDRIGPDDNMVVWTVVDPKGRCE